MLLGYKRDWGSDPRGAAEYFGALNHAIDLHLSLAILR